MEKCNFGIGDNQECIFAEIMKKIDTGIIILDMLKKTILFENDHAVKILEHGDAGNSYDNVYALLKNEIMQLQREGVTRSSRTKKHKGHKVYGYSIYRMAGDSRYVFVFIRDITDQHRLEAIDEASEMMNNIGYLFSGIRHEIGNPLNSIKMALTVMQNNSQKLSKEDFDTYFKRIFGEVTKIEILLKSFKNFNMFERPHTSVVDIGQFFDDLIQLLGADLSRKDIGIFVDFPEDAKYVQADPRALQHVIMNIFANAMDAMTDKEGATLRISASRNDGVIELIIMDNGQGMSEEHLKDVFKPFYTTKQHGTGLGLAISKKLLTQMNSSIDISSQAGYGTTVTITIPVAGGGQAAIV